MRRLVARFVNLRLLGHHDLAVEQTTLIDDKLGCPDISLDYGLSLKHNLLRRDNGAPHFAADRHVLGGDISIDLSRDTDREALACRNFTRDFSVDSNIALTSDFALDNRSRANQVEFFDRIRFQSQSSF